MQPKGMLTLTPIADRLIFAAGWACLILNQQISSGAQDPAQFNFGRDSDQLPDRHLSQRRHQPIFWLLSSLSPVQFIT